MTNMEHARQNAKSWFESIEEMLQKFAGWEKAARDAGWNGPLKDRYGVTYFECEDGANWACGSWRELCEAHDIDAEEGDEDARREIEESVLSVTVRDGWRQPGQPTEDGPDEYEILLSTGGPALRIWGKLDAHCNPTHAEMQMQDWGTPWTRYPAPEDVLLRFASVFWFGE